MGTVRQKFEPRDHLPASSNYPTLETIVGTNFLVQFLAFDGATEETCYFPFEAINYGSGNLTLKIKWYAASGTSGDVIWGAALAAITPNTDTQDIETKAFATAQTVTDSHLGTTAKRLHEISLTISNLDSIAAGDWCVLKFYRDADAAGDTLNNIDARLVGLELSYSDS